MGLFDFFKKKKGPEEKPYDPNNVTLHDLRPGFVVEYDLRDWLVVEEYEYDWGDNFFTKEYKLQASDEHLFLSVEEDDELELAMTRKLKPRVLDENLPEYIVENLAPPKTLDFEGVRYYRDKENAGYFRNVATTPPEQSAEFMSWDYYDASEKLVLTVEQWGERSFEAAVGKKIALREINNIYPGERHPKTF